MTRTSCGRRGLAREKRVGRLYYIKAISGDVKVKRSTDISVDKSLSRRNLEVRRTLGETTINHYRCHTVEDLFWKYGLNPVFSGMTSKRIFLRSTDLLIRFFVFLTLYSVTYSNLPPRKKHNRLVFFRRIPFFNVSYSVEVYASTPDDLIMIYDTETGREHKPDFYFILQTIFLFYYVIYSLARLVWTRRFLIESYYNVRLLNFICIY